MTHATLDTTLPSPRGSFDVATLSPRPAQHRSAAERVAAWRQARRQRRWGWLFNAVTWLRTWLHISR
jgi:hypothetical protein